MKDILNRDNIFQDYLRSKYTTIEDLLSHRLGIPSNNNLRLDDTLTRQNLVEYVIGIFVRVVTNAWSSGYKYR